MDIQTLLNRHAKPILFFSGGKDSLACLMLLRDFWDQITVAWANPGAPHPEVLEYMQKIRERVPHFVEIQGNQPDWILRQGWPSDVVPIRASRDGELGAGVQGIRIQSYTSCCWANMWEPMQRFVEASGSNLIIMGQRREEGLKNRLRDDVYQVIEGVAYWHPINDWSRSTVFEYLESIDEPLPPFYKEGAESSTDCWNCTAYLDHGKARFAKLKRDNPEGFQELTDVLRGIANEIQKQSTPLFEILGEEHGT